MQARWSSWRNWNAGSRLGAEHLCRPLCCIASILPDRAGHQRDPAWLSGWPGGHWSGSASGVEPERIVIRIEDDGTAFDPTAYVPAALADVISQRGADRRQGNQAGTDFADQVHHRGSAAGNQLTLVFRTRVRLYGIVSGTRRVNEADTRAKPRPLKYNDIQTISLRQSSQR